MERSRASRTADRRIPAFRAALLFLALTIAAAGATGRAGTAPLVGEPEDPVFHSDFETAGLCEWTNILAACDDANECTDDLCAGADGSCSHENNTDACDLPNASGVCGSGSCGLDGCDAGFSNCDGNVPNGCEVDHATAVNSCGSALYVGSYSGDTQCGFICDANSGWFTFDSQTARAEKWFRGQVDENSSCAASIEHRIRLTVPAGADYDLYAYTTCGESAVASSTNRGNGLSEELILSSPDDPPSDDSFDYWIEVRHFGGASCADFTIFFDGHTC